ncbi:MAG: hypothetical protein K0R15_626 [Clostridiales bacterium]|jgi:hypothetical protein|nr:hypothetical protein [Clostridiales bacterium]
MRSLKPKGIEINLDNKPRKLLFTLNVIDDLQEHYNLAINEVLMKMFGETEEEKKKSYNILKYIMMVLINEDVDIHNDENSDKWEKVSERYVGRILAKCNTGFVVTMVLEAFSSSLMETEEEEFPNENSKQ